MFTMSAGAHMIPLPTHHPFAYDLGLKLISTKTACRDVTICCHGYGHNSQIADVVASFGLEGNIVGFNFPDYDLGSRVGYQDRQFGTIEELLPLLYMIKYYASDLNLSTINLYGFSAGGAAVINALVVLHKRLYLSRLQGIGITEQEINRMLNALQNGLIILDCPLKSVEEIIAFRGRTDELAAIAKNYARNHMRPIDVVAELAGLKLQIMLNFQKHDDILGNRDDARFIELLRTANNGVTTIITSEGQHNEYHKNLWDSYRRIITCS
jgi:hypothetical protein